MFKKFNPQFKQRLSGFLRSQAEKSDNDSNAQQVQVVESSSEPQPTSPQRTSHVPEQFPAPRPQQQQSSLVEKSPSDAASLVQEDAVAESPSNLQKSKISWRLPDRLTQLPNRLKNLSHRTFHNRRPRFWISLGIGTSLSSGAIALGVVVYQIEGSLPDSVDEILTYAPPGTITIQAADGTVLQEIGHVTHEKLKRWQIPDHVSKAFIASEDRRFQEHQGVDFLGIARAIFVNLQAGEVVEGGSTITQQLARTVFLNQDRNFARKYREMRLAKEIEENFDKEEILERYLNLVYLGSGAYGVADAAWVYFSKPVDELTLAESAMLAGIVPAPSVYSPLENPQAAKERRNEVLKKMQAQGLISDAEAEAAIASPLAVKPSQPKRLERKAAYFTEYIQKELPKYVAKDLLNSGGIVVETTLNTRWQEVAEATVEKTVANYGKWQRFEQAALVSIDPRNGQIKAMVGGTDFEGNQFNRVTQAKRQPGSTFKTFVYAAAIASGISPYRSFLDAEYVVDGYKPENYGDSYSGAQVPLRTALAKSLNVVAVRILVDVGWNPVIKVSEKMGIESKLEPTYSLALGAYEVTLLELTSAYGTLANQGTHQQPYGISRVLDRHGKVLYQAKFTAQEALDRDSSSIVTWMLQGVVEGGTGVPAQIGRPAAGKTGTSDKARDLWYIGYIPQLVTGIWLGNDNNQETWGASSIAAAAWRQFMLEASEDIPVETFPKLPNQIDGRKGSIKAEPLKPKRSYYNFTTVQANTRYNNSQQITSSGQSYQPRRRRRVQYNQPTVNTAPPQRTTRSSSVVRSQNNSAPPSTSLWQAPKPSSAPASQPEAAPNPPSNANSNFSPPAPPASRKEE